MKRKSTALARVCFMLCLFALGACAETFDPAPSAIIVGNDNGLMTTERDAPLVVQFSEKIVRETLVARVVLAHLDLEENLPDERTPPDRAAFEADTLGLFSGKDPAAARGGEFSLTEPAQGSVLTFAPTQSFAISTPYMLIIEPGLEDGAGHPTRTRIKIPFAFGLVCSAARASLPSGYYFFLLNVDPPPVATQLRLDAHMLVDQEQGTWRALFTNARRVPALNARAGCPSDCGDQICRLYPEGTSACVLPSAPMGSVDELLDFLPVPEPPDGFTFSAAGCAADQADGSVAFGTDPFVIDLSIGGSIQVHTENTVVTGSFAADPGDPARLRAAGRVSVGLVQLNGQGTDSTQGTLAAINLFPEEVAEIESFGTPIPTL
jgi:hypothetical protein